MSRNGRGTQGQVGSELAESIQNTVSRAITIALAPVLQSLQQGQSACRAGGHVPHGGSQSDEDDFEPFTKKRYILLRVF